MFKNRPVNSRFRKVGMKSALIGPLLPWKVTTGPSVFTFGSLTVLGGHHYSLHLLLFFFFLPSSILDEDVLLKTNKQVYSQLLRATANKNASLLERVDLLIHLLDQLARGGGGSTAVQWLPPGAASTDAVSAFCTRVLAFPFGAPCH